jgi:glycine/D-amino acid oxidase-like deaminating enzyme
MRRKSLLRWPIRAVVVGVPAAGLAGAYWLRSNFSVVYPPTSGSNAAAPKTAIVVGGGVVGLCTAFQLEKRGLQVTLLDGRDGPEEAASFGNAGTLGASSGDHTLASLTALRGYLKCSTRVRGEGLYSTMRRSRGGTTYVDHLENAFIDPYVALDEQWWWFMLCLGKLLVFGSDRGLADMVMPTGGVAAPKSSLTRLDRAQHDAKASDRHDPMKAVRRRHDEAQKHIFALADELGCTKEAGMQRSGRLTVHLVKDTDDPRPNFLHPVADTSLAPRLEHATSAAECSKLAPILAGLHSRGWLDGGNALQTVDGQGDSAVFCGAMEAHLKSSKRCELRYGVGVSSLLLSHDGATVTGVADNSDERHTADIVVVCAAHQSPKRWRTLANHRAEGLLDVSATAAT